MLAIVASSFSLQLGHNFGALANAVLMMDSQLIHLELLTMGVLKLSWSRLKLNVWRGSSSNHELISTPHKLKIRWRGGMRTLVI
ncbi:hypothetical protein OGAPHI_000350 [Ogataea philodendri]|uniref:Uncharacterized protein n=1 Tax=Ogataea philodendri TaxID=1378263 RepID=A0A9P8TAS7_9ASCO|nr:uncharacterized protein OGAPHI_000350 [Ogataea philodendri]KAH3671645.1 hypothetical protein OGAPHI_000350 [Ogataea philodendri]